MGNVKVFKNHRGNEAWQYVVDFLKQENVDVYDEYSTADVSIVLSGRFENPLGFTGKKVLAYDAGEWMWQVPTPHGFELYKPVLKEYYDEMIDLTGATVQERVDKIKTYIGGLNV